MAGDLLDLAAKRLDWLDARQKVLARNVANSDTPGFVPRDEKPFAAMLPAGVDGPTRTDPAHLAGTLDGTGAQPGSVAMPPKQRAIAGNGVALDEQLTKVADTDTQQRLVTGLYGKYMSMFATAVGKG
ncbi:MAG: flagellar biosynthesis protein FlgB [Gluconacetobacter diazotrophicus]|nr:flagellar biosynthesis protein FlgB [Gluconacetobacter diazotrophicus]